MKKINLETIVYFLAMALFLKVLLIIKKHSSLRAYFLFWLECHLDIFCIKKLRVKLKTRTPHQHLAIA